MPASSARCRAAASCWGWVTPRAPVRCISTSWCRPTSRSAATARSAALALHELDAEQVGIAARDEAKAAALADAVPGVITGGTGPLRSWTSTGPQVVVSTVPGGAANEAVAATVDGADLEGVVLLDVVYADWPTPLARAARERGATVVSGLEMLVHQAARQFELFTGEPAPVAAMQAAGRAALGHTPDA